MKTRFLMMSALLFAGATVAQAQDAAAPADPAMAPAAAAVAAAPAADLPTCSKTVTDKCINRTAKSSVHHHSKVVKKTSKTTTKSS